MRIAERCYGVGGAYTDGAAEPSWWVSGDAEVWAKLETMNPGGSVKDRAALGIVLDAERRGVLKAGRYDLRGDGGEYGRWAGADRREPRVQGDAVCSGGVCGGEVHADARAGR